MSADRFDAEYTGFSGDRSLLPGAAARRSDTAPDDRRADHRARGSRVKEGPRGSTRPHGVAPRRSRSGAGVSSRRHL